MVKSLVALGWLRDLAIILLLLAGNHVRRTSGPIGAIIIVSAAIVLVERFLWSWHVLDVSKPETPAPRPRGR